MAQRISWTSRRGFVAGFSAVTLAGWMRPLAAAAQPPQSLTLVARLDAIALQGGQQELPVWSLQPSLPTLRFKRGQLVLSLQNALPVSCVLNWHGLDGAQAAEPLTAQAPLAPGAGATLSLPLRHAGTHFCDLGLLADGRGPMSRPLALVVEEDEPPKVDRDELFMIEDWRLGPDAGEKIAAPVYSVNGRMSPDITVRTHERLRLRFINGCQRAAVALKIEGHDARVMALDGEPAEPFLARNGAIVLAPGGRADAFVDATSAPGSARDILLHDGKEARAVARLVTASDPPVRPAPLPAPSPLPSNGLPAELDLRGALRVDLPLGGAEWVSPASFRTSAAPAFQAKAGRIVVLAVTNRAEKATTFHLHGHHFRLLDRLDDGWKPFWLDTLTVEPGQTQRIAFAAEHAGRFLIEGAGADWSAPRLVRWYGVS
ncbi:MAG: multicopper oxidase domain-containing protein [Bradyrhizobium sp.]|nr:multicopper oxidase domain-containing protein [Bradyrhizobium sp.]